MTRTSLATAAEEGKGPAPAPSRPDLSLPGGCFSSRPQIGAQIGSSFASVYGNVLQGTIWAGGGVQGP